MTRITRDEFLNDFKRDGNFVDIDVKNLDASTLEKLKKAGVSQTDLEKIAGTDGKISGDSEYKDLYKSVDGFEKINKSQDYFDSKDSKNAPTVSGQVHDALKLEVDRNLNISRAQGVIKNSTAVPSTDPHMKHVEDVRKELVKEKLPTSAKGVTVLVMGDEAIHGAEVTRTIAGKAGLAQDADVRFQKSGDHQTPYINNHRYTKALPAKSGGLDSKGLCKIRAR